MRATRVIMYMKIVTEGVPHHLCAIDTISYEAKTVCGLILTEYHSWKRIRALEGDECTHCAELAFGRSVPSP